LKIRVSMVRFRPRPPFSTFWFSWVFGHHPRTIRRRFAPKST